MIDVHHTILPLTARPTPDAAAMIADSVPLENGLRVLSPADMIVHAAAHLFADGDLAGGLRNLWDIDRLVARVRRWARFLVELPSAHGGIDAVAAHRRGARLANVTLCDAGRYGAGGRRKARRQAYARRLLARDGWGRETREGLRLAFYVRSHCDPDAAAAACAASVDQGAAIVLRRSSGAGTYGARAAPSEGIGRLQPPLTQE